MPPIFYAADNGTSGEGTPNGSVNENKFFNGYPDEIAENMKLYDKLGSPDTYEHFPTGWAVAFSTPFQMFKRYSEYSGGTADPLVISWPKGIKAHGEVRNQYHHSVDIVPTILDIVGIEMPTVYRGVEQFPLSGVSMEFTFDAVPDAPTHKHRQYYAMLGTRGIWEDGWFASALHAPITGKDHFDQDQWQLYHVDVEISTKQGGAETIPRMPIAALRPSGEVGISRSLRQREFPHSLDRFKTGTGLPDLDHDNREHWLYARDMITMTEHVRMDREGYPGMEQESGHLAYPVIEGAHRTPAGSAG